MKYDITHAIRKIYPNGAGYVQKGNEYSGLEWLDERPKPTEKELMDKIVELDSAEPLKLLREERNRKLQETDWWAAGDRIDSMTNEQKIYRKQLRDLPSTASPELDENGQLLNVIWPTKPK